MGRPIGRFASVLLALLTGFSLAWTGSLEPPGPPGPTMKTLEQIQAKPVKSLAGWPTAKYVIEQPGSYYLTENLVGETGKTGILITSDAGDVTLDLNGFAVIGADSPDFGISVLGPRVTVRNGSVRNWGNAGLSAVAPNSLFENIVASDNGAGFLLDGQGAVVNQCAARSNGSGFVAIEDSVTVRNSTASSNLTFDVDPLGRGKQNRSTFSDSQRPTTGLM